MFMRMHFQTFLKNLSNKAKLFWTTYEFLLNADCAKNQITAKQAMLYPEMMLSQTVNQLIQNPNKGFFLQNL